MLLIRVSSLVARESKQFLKGEKNENWKNRSNNIILGAGSWVKRDDGRFCAWRGDLHHKPCDCDGRGHFLSVSISLTISSFARSS